MAKLGSDVEGPWDGPWDDGDLRVTDFDRYLKAEREALDAIRERCISFPRGDGKALYLVESLKPLVLRWVPFGDRWSVEPALLRGLRVADVREMLDQDSTWGDGDDDFNTPEEGGK